MDLQLYARVLWRFRVLVAFGLALGLTLAFFSYVRVGGDGLAYREQEEWLSRTQLLVTQEGSPELRSTSGDPETGSYVDSGRLAGLAALYSTLVDSDGVRKLMAPKNPPAGRIVSAAVTTEDGLSLPLITLEALSSTSDYARTLARLQSESFIELIERQQVANSIPRSERVEIRIVSQPSTPFVFTPRSKTVPIVVFLSVLVATIAVAFVLENIRPTARPDVRQATTQVRSAA
jgi:hypothetical protein